MARETTRNREEILRKAALKVFCRKGYHYASIRDVAQEAGIQTGSVYYYVSSKEALLEDALTSDMEEMGRLIEQIANSDLSPEVKLRDAVHAHIGYVTEHLDGVGVFMQDWHSLSPERESRVIARRDNYEALFRRIIQEGITSGDFCEVDVALVTFAILGMCNYLFIWYSKGGKSSAREIAEAFAALLLNGLVASPAREDERQQHRSWLTVARKVQTLREALQALNESQAHALAEIEQEIRIPGVRQITVAGGEPVEPKFGVSQEIAATDVKRR
ncbi:MAG: TetR/AcrR family transcriptional regulator [Chloroflexi bacterium]|nr:TetR/AcrR family transcriptional regulator [Chloroflexota bacterium]